MAIKDIFTSLGDSVVAASGGEHVQNVVNRVLEQNQLV